MSRYSLWNPFFFSAYHDPRTFKGDTKESKSDNKSDNKPAVKTTTTAQPKSQAAAKDEPTFKTLAEASAAGYHGQAVNIEGKGLQKVEFADKSYNDKMANVSANANSGKTSVASSATTQSKSTSQPATKSTVTQATVAGSAGTKLSDGTTSLGQVSETGQYAGDGYVWHKNDNTNALTRVKVEGDQFDNNLGTDVITGGTADKDTKEAVAAVSLNEGTGFADSKASATDGSVLDLFRDEEDQVGSGSFADQVGVVDYTPKISYSSSDTGADIKQAAPPPVEKTFGETFRENLEAGNKTFEYKGDVFTTELAPEPTVPSVTTAAAAPSYATMGIGEAGRGQPELRVSDQEDTTQRRATEEDLFEQPVTTPESQDFIDGLPDYTFDPTEFAGPQIDYTVSQGEAGRGGPDSAAPTFSYQPNIDPVKETLVSLKNTAPETLSTSEYLIASEYEKQKGLDTASPTSTVSVTPEVEVAGPVTQLPSSPDFAMPGTQQAAYAGSAGPTEIGGEYDPRNILPTSEQMAEFEGTAQEPVDLTPQTFAEQALQALKSTFLDETAAGLQGGASALDLGSSRLGAYEVINPNTGRVETVRLGGEQPTSFDTARTAVVPAVAALQEQAQTEYEKIDPAVRAEMEASQFTGSAKDLFNLEFPTAGESTGRGIALNTIGELADIGSDVVTGLTLGLPAVFTKSFAEGAGSATQEIDAKLDQMVQSGTLQQDPRFTDAVRVARDALMEAGVDPGLADAQAQNEAIEAIRQGAYGEAIAPAGGVAAVGDTFLAGLAKPGTRLLPTNKLIGVPAAALGGATSEATTEGTEQLLTNRAMIEGLGAQDVALGQNVGGAATQAFLAGGAGAGGVRTFTPSQPDTTQYVPPAETTGQVAQAPVGVESSYDQEAQGAATTMERVAAQEIIDNVKAEEGTVSPQVLQNLQNATGLSMQELNDMASDSVVSLGNFSIDPAVGSPIASDLRDQPTGIGGGSNISVEPLPSGDTLLRNNDTGRTTVVNQGEDLAAAIQTFDEVTTPFVDTRNPLQLTADMQVGVDDTGSRINFLPTEADQAPMVPTTTRDTDIDLSSVPSRLTLTDAQSLGPTTPDLSGITSNLNLSLPTDAVTSKMDADAAAPADTNYQNAVNLVNDEGKVSASYVQRQLGIGYQQAQDAVQRMEDEGLISAPNHVGKRTVNTEAVAAAATPVQEEAATTDQTARVMEVLQNARSQQIAGSPQLVSKTGIKSLIDAGLVSEEAALTPMMATSSVEELLRLGPDEVKARMGSDVAAEVEVDETTETPVFTSVRAEPETTETPVFSTIRDTDTTEDTVVELDETPVFTSVRGDTTQDTEVEVEPETEPETAVEVEVEPETSVDVEPETEVEVEVEPETTTDVKTTVDIPPVIEEPEEEPEVEEPVTETEPDVEPPTDIFVPPVTTTDDDGNEVTECPEGYRMVTTGEGPMCMKSFSMERQRAGAGTRAYTGLAGNIGRRGPGQRRKTTTQTARVRPTVRRT